MTKRLSAVTGEYTDKQTNQPKAEWTNIGVILQSQNGKEYMLLDPSVSLSGVLAKQNALAMKKGEQVRDNVMVSLIEENQQCQQQGGYGHQQQQQNQYNQQQQGGFSPQQQGGFNQQQGNNEPPF